MQYGYLPSRRLLWGRFIGTHGQAGQNIPNDLHCKHLAKTSIHQLQTNKTTKAMERVASALGTLYPILHNFTKTATWLNHLQVIGKLKAFKILNPLLSCLNKAVNIPERKYSTFMKPRNPLHAMLQENILEWIKKHISSYFVE